MQLNGHMDENSIKNPFLRFLAAELPWAFTSPMAKSPRFLSSAPIELGLGFFYAPTRMSRVTYTSLQIYNAIP